MEIFKKIKDSIYNPDYYNEVLEKPFSYSFKYYLLLALLFAAVFAIVLTIKFAPAASFLSNEFSKVSDHFPESLTVTVKDGKASTNVNEPYFVKLPKDFKTNSAFKPESDNIENLIVLNTKEKFDLEKFNSYKTVSLLTEDSIVYMSNKGEVTMNSLTGAQNFILNRGVVVDFIKKVSPFLFLMYPAVLAGGYIAGFMFILCSLVYLLFGALIVWVVAEVKGLKIGYKKSYQLGIHLMTSVIIITGLISLIPAEITTPFLSTALLALFAMLNLKKKA